MSFFNPTHLINTYGTVGLLLVVFLESGILPAPLPGDSLLFLAGLFATTNATNDHPHLNLAVVLFGAVVLAFAGAQIGYFIGAQWGTKLFKPDARFFKTKYEEQAHAFFESRGSRAIVIARFIPFVRTIVPILAGTSEMKTRVFTIYNLVGATIWAGGITLLGVAIGDRIGEKNVEKYDYAIVAVIIVLSLIPPFLEYRRHQREKAAAAQS